METSDESADPAIEANKEGSAVVARADASDRRGLVVVGLIAVVALGYLFSRSGSDSPGDLGPAGGGTTEVVYKLTGTADSADITIETPSGTSQQQGVGVPLKTTSGAAGLTFTFGVGDFVYISAQNNGDGNITCIIEGTGGLVIAKTTSVGEYAIATCDGRAL